MRLRTEHWVLLVVLGLGLALLVLQLRQRWSFPALQGLTTATPGAAAESAPQQTGPKNDSEPRPPAPSTQDPPPAPAEAHPQQPAAPQSAAAAEGSSSAEATAAAPPGSPAPPAATTKTDAAMELRLEPARVQAQQPFVIFVALQAPAGVAEVVFDLAYDAGIVSPEAGTHAALNALAVDATLPEMIVESPGAGRMRIRIRRTQAEAPSSRVSSDLCAFQFMATHPGRTTLRLEGGRLHFSDGTQRNVGAHEAELEVD